ncbi:MAG: gliding motility-associated C-terminal domain-containing protein, partial [Flavobacteriales bacterium]|nr:gliding motility-associated C-terminal domain-containing protein [Flavobacteriales bacterium]
QVRFINTTQNADHYSWTFDELGGSSAFSPVFLFPEKFPGTYEVCLVAVQDPFDCTDTLCQMVEIEDVLFTYVPNSFTPDGDGVNDLFFMSSNIPDFLSFELLVFDRWGEVIFDTEDPFEGWNGSYGNSGDTPVQDGVYVWKIRLQQRTTGAIRELTGHVTLIR